MIPLVRSRAFDGKYARMQVRPEQESDHGAIRQVNRLAFGGDLEADLVDALRDGGYLRISLVAEFDGELVGHIAFSELSIETRTEPLTALALAPLAVIPEKQRQGIGGQLVEQGLDACRAQGYRAVLVLGHPEYYQRFGFSAALAQPLESPYSGEAYMAIELEPDVLEGIAGRVVYPPPFS